MKIIKKIAPLFLAVCLLVPCFSTLVQAADAIQFTDPSTKTGETVEVTCAVKANTTIEDVELTLSYDTEMLRFKEADGVTEVEKGTLTYKGTANATVLRVKLTFDALKVGTANVSVDSYRVWSSSDQELTLSKGKSTIKIEQGENPAEVPEEPAEAAGTSVDLNGETYTFTDAFPAAEIPEGFAETTIEYAGTQHKVVQHEVSGTYLGYLVNAENVGKFFVYIEENATFAPFEQISISDSTKIALLTTVDEVTVPEEYVATTVTLNGQEFPAWQSESDSAHCLLYAMNNKGEIGFYRLDTAEGTYQRVDLEAAVPAEKKQSTLGSLSEVLESHLDKVILVSGIGFIVLVVIIIVLGIKLYNRNAELDELYEEYGLFDDDEKESEDEDDDDVTTVDTFGETRVDEDNFEEEFTVDISDAVDEDVIVFDHETDETASEARFEEDSVNLEKKVEIFAEEMHANDPKFDETENLAEEAVVASFEGLNDFLDDDDDADLDYEVSFIDLDD